MERIAPGGHLDTWIPLEHSGVEVHVVLEVREETPRIYRKDMIL